MNWLSPILMLLAAFLAVFFEASFSGYRNLLLAQIDLLPVLMVYTSLTHGILLIAGLAVAGGLWFDSLSANPLGASVLPLFVIGLAIYRYRGVLLRENTYAQFMFGLGASAAAPLMTLLIVLGLGENPMIGWLFLWQLIVMSLVGAVLTPLCFRVFDFIERKLNYQPVSEPSFRPDREIKRGRS